MKVDDSFARRLWPAVAFAGFLSFGGIGIAQTKVTTVPDAQVEANVLKALAGAQDLAAQSINTTTVYGTVTLSGSVSTEAQRDQAEQLAANAPGVQKVVDELTVGAGSAVSQAQGNGSGVASGDQSGPPLGGGYPQADTQQAAGAYGQQGANDQDVPPPNGPNTDPYGRPLSGSGTQQQPAPSNQGYGQPPYASPQASPYGTPQAGQQPYGYPPQGGQMPQYGYNQPNQQAYGPPTGQRGGDVVTVPSGTLLQVRVNQHLNSKTIQAGTPFDAIVVNDIVANGQVAIPRGASVQGTVIEAKSSGTLGGRGDLGLRLDQVTLAGQTYPITSDVFSAHGGDKTVQTVNSAVGLGALGAIFGAVAGGGAGAAIGAGVGGAVGLGASAASGRGNVFIPSEAVLNFRLVQPATVTTVSQVEMQRLGYGVPAAGPQMVRRYPPPPYYYRPGYYPPYYYRPYGYYYR